MSEHSWEEIVEDIKLEGWHQGSAFGPADSEALFSKLCEFHELLNDLRGQIVAAIIVSHSCDIQNIDTPDNIPAEPFIEIMFGSIYEGPKVRQKRIRNVDLVFSDGAVPATYRFEDIHRFRICRKILFKKKHNQKLIMEPKSISGLRRFLAKRYDRPAFPDLFEDYLRPATSKIRDKLKKKAHLFTGVYFKIEPEVECQDGYTLTLTALMSKSAWLDQPQQFEADQLIDKVVTLINEKCEKITIPIDEGTDDLLYHLEPENVFTVEKYRKMIRYDYDYLSTSEDDSPLTLLE